MKRAQAVNYSGELLEKVGLVIPRSEQGQQTSSRTQSGGYYDRFRGRVLFPINDAQGRVVAFGGRVLPQFAATNPAKYINSPETPLFSKHKLLYGLDSARSHDKIAAHRAGDGRLYRLHHRAAVRHQQFCRGARHGARRAALEAAPAIC